ncbi:MAG: EAL domain-containing protein [Alphaproteobacteria bacterium]|nr:EAL domain-containing protein [Alphaproteobacteria bacterium]MBV9372358.1 EAL domain-containing protein [Alphaproteobacteria bacterium]MBV9899650.1 EAL domain-containing protein [Alphaproteobacteria bacterium]
MLHVAPDALGPAQPLDPASGLEDGFLAASLEAAGVGTWRIDMVEGVAFWDALTSATFGWEPLPRVVADPLAQIHLEDREWISRSLDECFEQGVEHDVEFRVVRADGESRWVRAVARPLNGDDGRPRWVCGVLMDVTRRKCADLALEESRRQLATLVRNLPGVAYRCQAEPPWSMDYISDAVEDLTGYPPAEWTSHAIAWADIVHRSDAAALLREVERAAAAKDRFRATYRIVKRSGEIRWVLEQGQPVYDGEGRVAAFEGFIGDITEQKHSEEQVRWIANHDPLTELPNRLLFQERLDALAAGDAGPARFALLLLDIDEFKRVNDTLGHDAGDALLCAFARRLKEAARADDLVARLGGDEFAVVLNGVADEDEVTTAVESLLQNLRQPWVHGGMLLDCDASIGASLYPLDGTTRAELMKHADIALYVAKAAGRGNLKLFQPAMRSEMQTRISMLALARDAIDKDWIVPFYQPKVDLRTGAHAGFEALLRWRHPGKGFQSPDTIAAAFDDLTIACGISGRMIDGVIRDMRRWLDAGLDFGHVAINAAAAEFRTGDFAERLLERLADADIPPRYVQIEVTETVFLGRGAECVERTLKALSAAGVTIALDDFGTGYASLSHLKQFPVDLLKIDRSFVHDLTDRPDAAAIIRAVINLGHSLDIRIVAEGIETAEQQARLAAQGCDFGQGFLYSPAVGAAEVPDLLAERALRLAG